MAYFPARHITTRLRLDAESGLERLDGVSRLLREETPAVLDQMRRLWREEKDASALQYLERYEQKLRDLAALMTELGTDHVEQDTIGVDHGLHRLSQRLIRDHRSSPPRADMTVPEDFLTDPTNIE